MKVRIGRLGRALPYLAASLIVFSTLVADLPGIRLRESGGCLGGAAGAAGVIVDSKGVLRTYLKQDPTGELSKAQVAAAKASLDGKLTQKSALRKVSLQRLEKAVAAHMATGRQIPNDMKYLAGLTRIQNVFFYPESGDIVLAGPAEPFGENIAGRAVGLISGKAVVELADLVVGLRSFAPGGRGTKHIGCSIDATQEGLKRMQDFLARIGTQANPADPAYTQFIVDGLRDNLGLQKVTIMGVSPDTHFAQVLVEADYRMKLIGIGLEVPPVKIVSYVERADAAVVARNAMQRWWFVPDYQCVRVSEDDLAMELVGNGVKLMGEDEAVQADGSRRTAITQGNLASQAFISSFTAAYPRLAEKHPVYAQLRNLIDIAITAAYIHEKDLYGKSGWQMAHFGDEQKFPVQTCQAPVEVETAVASRWKGNRLMTPVGGGVSIHAMQALSPQNLLQDEKGTVKKSYGESALKNLADGQWWWD